MRKVLFAILPLMLLAACQTLYTYHLPNEDQQKRFADSLHWGYSGSTIMSLPVIGEDGTLFRLPVTPKTKLEVRTEDGSNYRFYIQSIKISGDAGVLGSDQTWTGYELLNHTQVTLLVREIREMKILSEEKATEPIGILRIIR
ncbi:MAG: hypothetical protein ABI778_02000 [Ignavibacteriota bacterium]